MKSFGFTFITGLGIIALAYGGYFSISQLTHPASYIPERDERIGDIQTVTTPQQGADANDLGNAEVANGITTGASSPTSAATSSSSGVATQSDESTPPSSGTKTSLDLLKALRDQKIVLKVGSKGAYVGAVQDLMNQYFKKNLKIDNDFGKTLEADVKKFQTQNKISATGQVGPQTLTVMITWLGKQ